MIMTNLNIFGSQQRRHYQVIDGDDTEAGPLIDDGGRFVYLHHSTAP